SGSSDPYCVLKVDNEVVARTATVWKSLNPFWGEEIMLLLPRGFHSLAIYVLDEDTIGQDDVIGKVSLSRQQISAEPRGIDSWLSLAPVSPEQEVQGEIHLELWVPERGHPRVLRCHLIEARWGAGSSGGLPPPRGLIFGGREERRGWRQWWHGVCPPLSTLGRILAAPGWGHQRCQPTCDNAMGAQWEVCCHPCLGTGAEEHQGLSPAEWLALTPCFCPLVTKFGETEALPRLPVWGTALAVLEEVTSGESRQDVATKLVKLFLGQGLAVPLLDYLTSRELARTTDPNTLFRSNSLASKSMEQFMKVVGLPYLHEVLKPVVNRIFEEKKYVELDPGKMELSRARRISFKGSLSEAQVRESSLELLKGYLGDIVDAIVGSVDKCPLPMRVAFRQLRGRVEQRFPSAQHE
ncbi:RASL1 protein, partial [Calcarius ornatus]|nr:RASL1 protein [Calcarius ornatus]